jgi:hypothetical protein
MSLSISAARGFDLPALLFRFVDDPAGHIPQFREHEGFCLNQFVVFLRPFHQPVFPGVARLNGFIHRDTRRIWRFFDKLKKFLSRRSIVVFRGWIRQQEQPSLGKERHGIHGSVQVGFAHRTRVKTRRVHIRAGGVGEVGFKILEFARDGEFVVAEEKIYVRHGGNDEG